MRAGGGRGGGVPPPLWAAGGRAEPPAGIDVDGLLDRKHLERRVFGRDGADLVVARVRPGALEEDPDLCLPPLEVGAQDRYFLLAGELSAAEALGTPAQPQFAGAGGPRVAHPLGFAAGRDEVTAAIVGEQGYRRGTARAPLPALQR